MTNQINRFISILPFVICALSYAGHTESAIVLAKQMPITIPFTESFEPYSVGLRYVNLYLEEKNGQSYIKATSTFSEPSSLHAPIVSSDFSSKKVRIEVPIFQEHPMTLQRLIPEGIYKKEPEAKELLLIHEKERDEALISTYHLLPAFQATPSEGAEQKAVLEKTRANIKTDIEKINQKFDLQKAAAAKIHRKYFTYYAMAKAIQRYEYKYQIFRFPPKFSATFARRDYLQVQHQLRENCLNMYSVDANGNSLLHTAAQFADNTYIQKLLPGLTKTMLSNSATEALCYAENNKGRTSYTIAQQLLKERKKELVAHVEEHPSSYPHLPAGIKKTSELKHSRKNGRTKYQRSLEKTIFYLEKMLDEFTVYN